MSSLEWFVLKIISNLPLGIEHLMPDKRWLRSIRNSKENGKHHISNVRNIDGKCCSKFNSLYESTDNTMFDWSGNENWNEIFSYTEKKMAEKHVTFGWKNVKHSKYFPHTLMIFYMK